MDNVFITDLKARGILGISDREREKPQEILINLVLFSDLRKIGESDDIRDGVNYSTIAKAVMAHAETVRRLTIEALAEDLARVCLAVAGVQKVRVRVEKPRAVTFTGSVGVEIERTNPISL